MGDYENSISDFSGLVNYLRSHEGRGDLHHDLGMSEGCQKHNAWMAESGRFEHSPFRDRGECIGVITIGSWQMFSAGAEFYHLWTSHWSHKKILLSAGHRFGLALYWKQNGDLFSVYGTFRIGG